MIYYKVVASRSDVQIIPLRCLHIVVKSAYFMLSVRLWAGISAASTIRIAVEFDIGNFYENLSRKSTYV
jgi:hypothetical protein